MAADPGKPFEVPESLREIAQKSVDQARVAFDEYMTATQKAVDRVDGTASDAQAGAAELNRKLLKLAEENVAGAFRHAQELVRARDLQEMMKLQADFLKAQMASLGEQARVVSDAAAETATGLVDKARGKD